jgi:hypothetical protein
MHRQLCHSTFAATDQWLPETGSLRPKQHASIWMPHIMDTESRSCSMACSHLASDHLIVFSEAISKAQCTKQLWNTRTYSHKLKQPVTGYEIQQGSLTGCTNHWWGTVSCVLRLRGDSLNNCYSMMSGVRYELNAELNTYRDISCTYPVCRYHCCPLHTAWLPTSRRHFHTSNVEWELCPDMRTFLCFLQTKPLPLPVCQCSFETQDIYIYI